MVPDRRATILGPFKHHLLTIFWPCLRGWPKKPENHYFTIFPYLSCRGHASRKSEAKYDFWPFAQNWPTAWFVMRWFAKLRHVNFGGACRESSLSFPTTISVTTLIDQIGWPRCFGQTIIISLISVNKNNWFCFPVPPKHSVHGSMKSISVLSIIWKSIIFETEIPPGGGTQ